MMDGDTAVIMVGDLAALILGCLAGSTVMRLVKSTPWRVALRRGLGLAILTLVALLILRQALPDLFVFPLVFLVAVATDILTISRSESPADRYLISILISLSILGAFLAVDFVMRSAGHHLTALV